MRKTIDVSMVGKAYGRVTIQALVNEREREGGPLRWLCVCRCDCGTVWKTRASNVIAGNTAGCRPCAFKSVRRFRGRTPTKPEYAVWVNMRRRCRDENRRDYKDYGGRGIAVCKQWTGKGGFARFLADVGPRPSLGYSIERIDNNKGYEPGNVRWATLPEQNRNRRDTRVLDVNGERMCGAELARKCGAHKSSIYRRLDLGQSPSEILAHFSSGA
jgi:hypothetical protein